MASKTKEPADKEVSVTTPETMVAKSQEIIVKPSQLAAVESFADALAFIETTFGGSVDSSDLGDGYGLIKDKASLVDKPFAILSYKFAMGDYGPFAIAHIVTEDNVKAILTDGSSGICEQLRLVYETSKRTGGIMCRNGLRRSDYMYTDDKGEQRPATTYYLNTDA